MRNSLHSVAARASSPRAVVGSLASMLLLVSVAGCGPKKPPPLKPVPTNVEVPDKVPQTRTFWTPKDKPCPVYETYFKCRKATQGECVERRGTSNACKS